MVSDRSKLRIPPWLILLGVAIVAACVALFFLLDLPHVIHWKAISIHAIFDAIRRQGPVVFFAALAVLPAIGFPVSPFYLAAGGSFGIWECVIGIAVALAFNMSVTYWLARYGLRSAIERLLSRTRFRVPTIDDKNHVQLTLVLRIVPGAPFFVQNYLLGLAKVPFKTYFLISWPVQGGMAIGITLLGSAFYESSGGKLIFALALIVVVGVILHWARTRLRKKGFTDATAAQIADDKAEGN